MPNDLRDPKFRPSKTAAGGKSGFRQSGKTMGPWQFAVLFVAGVVLFFCSGAKLSGAALMLISACFFLLLLIQRGKEAKRRKEAGTVCGNPEPHSHFEREKPCGNRESHSHYGEKRTPSGRVWPDEREKRLLNQRHLYEAGLLTREEYEQKLRELRQDG